MSTGTNFDFDKDISAEWIEANAGANGPKALESGVYLFKITQMTKKTSKGAKYSGCPMAEVVLESDACKIYDWILLNTDFKQKLSNFLKSVYGAATPPSGFWDKLEGETVTIEVEKYVDAWTNNEGKEIESYKNKIVEWLPKGSDEPIGPNGKVPSHEIKVNLPTGEKVPVSELEGAPLASDDLPF